MVTSSIVIHFFNTRHTRILMLMGHFKKAMKLSSSGRRQHVTSLYVTQTPVKELYGWYLSYLPIGQKP